MKQYVNNKGYYTARLNKNGSEKTYLIHRLVAETFIPNPNNLPEVNHKDEKKNNNCVDNLHWCTKVFNNGYGKLDKYGRRKSRKHIMKKVAQYDLNGSLLNVYDGLLLAKERTGINNNCINRCCSGELKTSGGYIWKYVDDETPIEEYIISKAKKTTGKQVEQYDLYDNFIKIFPSCEAAARELGTNSGTPINRCARGERKTAYGFKWKYAGEV